MSEKLPDGTPASKGQKKYQLAFREAAARRLAAKNAPDALERHAARAEHYAEHHAGHYRPRIKPDQLTESERIRWHARKTELEQAEAAARSAPPAPLTPAEKRRVAA